MDIYLATPIAPFHAAAGASFGTFTTRQDVSPVDLPVIQGGTLRKGSKLWFKAVGEFSTTGTPTLALGFYIGTVAGAITTVIAESGAITTGSGAAAWPWDLEWTGVCTGTGASGTVVGSGTLQLGTSLTAFTNSTIPVTQALRTITWDTTIARAIGVCATYNTSSASNTVKTNNHMGLLVN